MSRQLSSSNQPWDMADRPSTPVQPVGDVAMTSPSTTRASGSTSVPQFPPDPSTPTQSGKKIGKKRKSSVDHLASQPRPPPSAPGSDAEGEAPPPRPTPSAPPSVAPSASSSTSLRPKATLPREESGRFLDNCDRLTKALVQWSHMDWEDKRDQMRVSRSASLLVQQIVQLGWHTLPFTNDPDARSLLSSLRDIVPKDPPTTGVTPVLTRGMAESSAQPLPPPSGQRARSRAPAQSSARPGTAGAASSGPPPRPPRSAQRPPPPVPAASRRSYADSVKRATDR